MAIYKTASAKIVRPDVPWSQWGRRRKTASKVSPESIASQAAEILSEPFDPKNYLLTHATIVCSVDVEEVPGVSVGRDYVSGEPIKRQFTDYYITKATEKYVNDNHDAWSRGVLLKSYDSFRGAQNYLEHVQDPAQSKGRIIDAVIRETGESLYVDILVATHKKHAALVRDIRSGKMATMSMGCTALFTICTKCGNVAYDDSDTCPCVRYSKGAKFLDSSGEIRIIAELCGHVSIEPNGGVEFVEASYVETPAFKGAVLRNLVEPLTRSQLKSARDVFASGREESSGMAQQRSASWSKRSYDFDDSEESEDSDTEETKTEPVERDRLKEVEDQAYDAITQNLTDRIRKDMSKYEGKSPDSDGSNNNMLNYASMLRVAHSAKSDADLIDKAAAFFYSQGVYIDPAIYRKALSLGALDVNHAGSRKRWAAAYRRSDTHPKHKGVLILLARLLSQRPHIKSN